MSSAEKSSNRFEFDQPHFGSLRAGLLFIIAGSLIYASQQGFVRDWFWWFTMVWGIILLVEVVIKLNIPRYRSTIVSPLIWGTILVGFSYHQLYGLDEWWPIALIAIGTGIILKGIRTNDSA